MHVLHGVAFLHQNIEPSVESECSQWVRSKTRIIMHLVLYHQTECRINKTMTIRQLSTTLHSFGVIHAGLESDCLLSWGRSQDYFRYMKTRCPLAWCVWSCSVASHRRLHQLGTQSPSGTKHWEVISRSVFNEINSKNTPKLAPKAPVVRDT